MNLYLYYLIKDSNLPYHQKQIGFFLLLSFLNFLLVPFTLFCLPFELMCVIFLFFVFSFYLITSYYRTSVPYFTQQTAFSFAFYVPPMCAICLGKFYTSGGIIGEKKMSKKTNRTKQQIRNLQKIYLSSYLICERLQHFIFIMLNVSFSSPKKYKCGNEA